MYQQLWGNYFTGSDANEVTVAGDYAYVVDQLNGLKVINISNPTSPTLVGSYNTPGWAMAVYVSGKYAYVADYSVGLEIYELNGLETPAISTGNVQASQLTITENVDVGNNLYVRSGLNVGNGGLMIDGNLSVNNTSTASYIAGNLGIGTTTTPAYKLDVNGTFRVTGTSTFGVIESGIWHGSTIGIIYGGTNSSAIGPAGSLAYSNGTSYDWIAAGPALAGYLLQVNASGTPAWVTTSSLGITGGSGIGGTGVANKLAFFSNTNTLTVTTTLHWDNTNGRLGIGTSTPGYNLTVVGSGLFTDYLSISGTTNTSTIDGGFNVGTGALTYNYTDDLVSVPNMEMGALNFSDDAGQVSWVDMAVTASSSNGTVLSYSANLDSSPLLTVFGVSNGSGSVATSGVAINTTTVSAYKLLIDSGSSTGAGLGVVGYVKATSYITGTTTLDLAETYPINPTCNDNNSCPEAGDLVCLKNSSSTMMVEKCSELYSNKIIGIISTNPGMVLGAFDPSAGDSAGANYRAVALSGRVPLKVSLANGAIMPGDLLTASAEAGVAVKATDPGFVVGIALEDFSSSTPNKVSIQVFVNPHWTIGNLNVEKELNDSSFENNSWLEQFAGAIQYVLGKLGLFIKSGVATLKSVISDNVTTKNIKTDTLCVGSTCVTEQQLQEMMQRNQVQPIVQTPDSNNQTPTDNGQPTTSTTQSTTTTENVITSSTDSFSSTPSDGGSGSDTGAPVDEISNQTPTTNNESASSADEQPITNSEPSTSAPTPVPDSTPPPPPASTDSAASTPTE